MPKITKAQVMDVRFPTSRGLHGSDAMNAAPDNSTAYCILHTDSPDGLCGHGFTLTCGRGNEICAKAIESLSAFIIGLDVEEMASDMGGLLRRLTEDGQMRWLGPQKGVVHLAAAAILNAAWDLLAKRAGKPLWKLLVDMRPEEIVALIDWRHLRDALTEDEALDILRNRAADRAPRIAEMESDGYPAYITSVAWLGYTDEQVRRLAEESLAAGWTKFKMKVGLEPADDARRARFLRDIIGADNKLMMDANQVWGVNDAIASSRRLAEFDPWWMEEPTHPDDILGHRRIAEAIAPMRVATGEHCANAVMFKQFMQAKAMAVCQIDSCRLASVNENIAVLLLAEKFGIPVCPHSGGVGLCEYVQHLAIFDYVAVSANLENRALEYVDHLHEHFLHPTQIRRGRYLAPRDPGYSAQMKEESLRDYLHPGGRVWQSEE